jgi:hypothetical protein
MESSFTSLRVAYLNPADAHFSRQGDTISLRLADGRTFPRVVLRNCFPMDRDSRYLSVRDATTEDHDEIGIIEDYAALAEEDRRAVETEVALFYFVPKIVRIRSLKNEFGFIYWEVDSDKGPLEFVMRDNVIHYVRPVGPNHYIIIDVNMARYEITDLTALDKHSQTLARQQLSL